MKKYFNSYTLFLFFKIQLVIHAANAGTGEWLGEQPIKKSQLTFAVISDLNKSYGSTTYPSHVKKAIQSILDTANTSNQIPLVLSTGDMVAGQKQGLDYKAMWAGFHSAVTNPLTKNNIAFAPSPGNHDAAMGKAFLNERVEYQNTFKNRIPHPLLNGSNEHFQNELQLLPGSNFPFQYAFIFQNSLFIALDATGIGPLSKTQTTWLRNTLISHADVEFKVIFGHMPLLPFAKNRAHEHLAVGNTLAAQQFENLLEEFQVDLFLSGHHHVFYSGKRQGHTQFVSVPCLGSGARALLNENEISPNGFLIFTLDKVTGIEMKAIQTVDLAEISLQKLPSSIWLPNSDSSDCKGCSQFAKDLFLDPVLRTLYLRSDR